MTNPGEVRANDHSTCGGFHICSEITSLRAQVERYEKALKFCAKPEGAYSRDHGQHAMNCLVESIKVAEEALQDGKENLNAPPNTVRD